MLQPETKTYFDLLSSRASADAWANLGVRQKAFERSEFSNGNSPNSVGFAARLAELYKESLSGQATAIVNSLKKAHISFHSPLCEEVDGYLMDWGACALDDTYRGLEGAYVRHMQRFGIQISHVVGLNHTYALAQATVTDHLNFYLWELRNVPAKRPQQPAPSVSMQVTINNTGTIGSLHTGAESTSYVQQQWLENDTSTLLTALGVLRDQLDRAKDIEPSIRNKLIDDIDKATVELQQENPDEGKLISWLQGVGNIIGTVGSLQPAYESVKSLARLLGLPI